MTNETPAAPAGWYPAAHAGNQLRYWDGNGWLDIAPPSPQGNAPVSPQVAEPRAEPAATRPPRVAATAPPVDLVASLYPKPKRRVWPLVVVPFAIVVLIGAGVIHFINNPPSYTATGYTPKPKPPTSSNPKPEVPAGFTDSGAGLAMKFVDRECSLSVGRCSHMEVIALQDCPTSVYVELNLLDTGGAVVGFTNDTVGSLRKGQTAILEFNVLQDATKRLEVVDVSCF